MNITSFIKKTCIFFILFLALFLIPNPVSHTFSKDVKASSIGQDDEDECRIKLNIKSKSCIPEETYLIKVYRTAKNHKISFKSSDSSVVSVKKTEEKEAEIKACTVGEATITVTVKEGSKTVTSLKCEVKVTPPAASVKLIDGRLILSTDDKVSLRKELKPSSTSETPTYYSSNPSVVTVSSKGIVTAVGEGKATIYASISNGTKDKCIIEVISKNP